MLRPVFASAIFVCFSGHVAAQGLKADRPEIKPGDSWEFSFRDTRYSKPPCSYSLTIKSVTNDKISGNAENSAECATANLTTAPEFDKDFNFLFPDGTAYPVFVFPLEVGKSWDREFDFSVGNNSWSNKLNGKVVGVEKVTVPAGTFDAFKVVLVRNYRGQRSSGGRSWAGTVDETWWYSPVVKYFVKRTYSDSGTSPSPVERELLKYDVR
jgi:hypothetical protein